MKKHLLTTQRVTVPTVYVTKGRQRVKQYNDNIIYLKNGDEFEIELFNPTTNKVLAKINLNGKSLGSGIILRPGERVFLERYFDEAKKFLFETYDVDINDSNVLEAIKMNGIIDVEFYDEYKQHPYVITCTSICPQWPYIQPQPVTPYTPPISTPWTCYSAGNTATSVNFNNNQTLTCNNVKSDFKETGRVEKGSYSEQSFTYDSTIFNTYHSWKTTWKILPESQKLFVKEDLTVYCSNCGAKRKKDNFKYCPNCGNKF
ncbi:MAG: hypothetical protein WC554_14155 [Clostridia bacterium]